MAEPIRIPVQVSGVDQALSEFERLSQAAQRAQQSGGVGGGGGALMRAPAGPMGRFLRTQAAYEANPNDFDTLHSFKRAQQGLERAEKLVHGPNPWADLVQTSRLNLGPISPLVNRLGAANPALATGLGAAGLTVEGLKMLGEIARTAAQALGEAAGAAHGFGTARMLSGGTTDQIASLRSFGLSGEQINGLSSQFRNRLATDPLAMAAAGQLGVSPQLSRAFGTQNEAQFLVRAVEGLRGIRDEEERLRVARLTGLEDLLDVAKVSEKVFQGMKRDAVAAASVFDERTQQQARDLSAELTRVNNGLENLKVSVFSRLFQPVADGANDFADGLNKAAQGIKNNPVLDSIVNTLRVAIFPGLGKSGAGDPAQSSEEQARQANTNAIIDLNRVLLRMTGASGPRGEASVPNGLRGSWPMLDAASRGALTKGAWKL